MDDIFKFFGNNIILNLPPLKTYDKYSDSLWMNDASLSLIHDHHHDQYDLDDHIFDTTSSIPITIQSNYNNHQPKDAHQLWDQLIQHANNEHQKNQDHSIIDHISPINKDYSSNKNIEEEDHDLYMIINNLIITVKSYSIIEQHDEKFFIEYMIDINFNNQPTLLSISNYSITKTTSQIRSFHRVILNVLNDNSSSIELPKESSNHITFSIYELQQYFNKLLNITSIYHQLDHFFQIYNSYNQLLQNNHDHDQPQKKIMMIMMK